MRYRAPTQLHASLYMRDNKTSAGSKVGRDTKKSGKCVANKEAYRKKK